MNRKLFIQAMAKFFSGVIVLGALLFLPAWSFAFWQGWLLLGILFVPMFAAGMVMMVKNPALLEKRLHAKGGLMFLACFLVAGFNFRFAWLVLPRWVSIAASVVFLLGYTLYAEVLRENTYLSRTIEVQENQKVIDTGLYGVVRHPMYLSTLILFLSMPFVLGSVISFGIMLFYIPIIAKRMRNEEAVLEAGLKGYADYKNKVKYKVIPLIW